jgi:uncharacterized protein (DUF4415 family)
MNSKNPKPPAITQEAWDSVESPDLSDDLLQRLRPLAETHPDIAEAYRSGGIRRRGPQKVPTKILVSIRYSEDVLDFFRATGPHWQTRMDEALQQWIREHPSGAAHPSK